MGKRPKREGEGRPTKYDPKNNEFVKNLAMVGLSDEDIAKSLGVAFSSVSLWKTKHPEFSEALRDGRDKATGRVAAALYKRAVGQEIVETKITETRDGVFTTTTTKEVPADVSAATLWLKTKQRHIWNEKKEEQKDTVKVVVKHEGKMDEDGDS